MPVYSLSFSPCGFCAFLPHLFAPLVIDRYHHPSDSLAGLDHSTEGEAGIDDVDTLMVTFDEELKLPFSFLEWGSGKGNVSMAVAKRFVNSTVISFEQSHTMSMGHWEEIKRRGDRNNIVGRTRTEPEIMKKLFASPEMLRYQYVSWRHFKELVGARGSKQERRLDREELGETLGVMVANSVSTFIQVRTPWRRTGVLCANFAALASQACSSPSNKPPGVCAYSCPCLHPIQLPSGQALSLALQTFFPKARGVYTGLDVTFQASAHPSPGFKDFEKRVLGSLIKMPQSAEVPTFLHSLFAD